MADPVRWLDELTGQPAADRALKVLGRLAAAPLGLNELARYHDLLMLEAAYPGSVESWRLARAELARFHERVAALDAGDRESLVDSGIVGAPQLYPYDLANAEWLASRPGARVDIAWGVLEARSRARLEKLVAMLVEPVEAPAVGSRGWGVRRVLDTVRGGRTAFDWLAERLRARYPRRVANYLFAACDLPLRVDPGAAGPSRTLGADVPPAQPSLRRGSQRWSGFDFLAEVKRPLRLGRPVSRRRGEALLGVVRQMILSRTRELHAMIHGNPDEAYETPLEGGGSLVVWLLRPEERLPLEVGWYFMLLRNGIPVAYGGGGLIATRAEVGMNLFEEFRGGREAAWILAQVCRAALSLCPAPWIVTRRYQFGGDDNEEGLASGAYWFYDKLGFRSVDGRVREVADAERRLIARGTGHRSARRILRRLASADVVLPLEGQDPSTYREYPLGAVGLRLCRAIAARFGGERAGLDAWLARAGGTAEPGAAGARGRRRAHTSLFELVCEPRDRRLLRRLARLKGAVREAGYARALPGARAWFERIAAGL